MWLNTYSFQVPQPNGLVVRRRREELAVHGPSHIRDALRVSLERVDDVAGLRVPQLDEFIRSLLPEMVSWTVHVRGHLKP